MRTFPTRIFRGAAAPTPRFVRPFVFAAVVGLLLGSAAAGQSIPLQTVAIKQGEFHYFLDDFLIENRFDQRFYVTVRRFVHDGMQDPRNPVLVADQPWEVGRLIGPASVIYDENHQLFRAYYHIYANPDRSTPSRVGYAESRDGVRWTKPELPFFPWQGQKTNIVFAGRKGASTFQLVTVPESAKKGFAFLGYYSEAGGQYLAGSKDGVTWEALENIIPYSSDCQHSIIYDPAREEFVTYFRNLRHFRQVADTPKAGTTRVISRLANKTLFGRWQDLPRAVLIPEDEDAVLFYGMSVTVKGGLYIGFLEQYKQYPQATIDIELRTSRDGLTWKRHRGGEYLFRRGTDGEWNGGMVKPAGLVEFGSEWLFYYTGYRGYHHEILPSKKDAAMGLLRFRKEGLVSLRSHESGPCYVITRPLRWEQGRLAVNFDGEGVFPTPGSLRVQVTDPERTVIKGFSYADCETFKGDSVRAKIRWQDADIASLAGREIRLEFEFRHGDLFGFVAE